MDNRRYFLKKLLGFPLVGGFLTRKTISASKKREYFINEFYAAGFQFYEGPEVLRRMNVGDNLQLRAEPENPYDRFAVELLYNDVKIGHVPRTDNKHISRLLRQGFPMLCRIVELKPDEVTWKQVKVGIWILNEEGSGNS